MLDELLDELDAAHAKLTLVFYTSCDDEDGFVRLLDQRIGPRGVGCIAMAETTPCIKGFALHDPDINAAIELLPQLDALSLLTLNTIPDRLTRALSRTRAELTQGKHVWMTLFDARTRREPFLTPQIARWAPIDLVGGSIASVMRREAHIIYHGRLWRHAAAVILLESLRAPMRAFQHTHLELTDRWLTATRISDDGLIVEQLDDEPAQRRFARALGFELEQLDRSVIARHPFGIRFRGRAYPIAAVRMCERGHLHMGTPVQQGERLNILEPIGLLERTREQLARLDQLFSPQATSGALLFDCVNRLGEAHTLGVRDAYAAALQRPQTCAIHSFGEQFGYMHLNCSLAGLVFGA
jgi:hypothetical protein